MRFENQPESRNIEDRRGAGSPMGRGFGGRGMRLPLPINLGGRRGGGLGLGGIVLILLLVWMSGGFDGCAGGLGGGFGGGMGSRITRSSDSERPLNDTPEEQAAVRFVGQVLATTEEAWGELFREHFGREYEQPRLVLFRDGVRSACGLTSSAAGPFYCPGDQQVYLDLSFFDDMRRSLGADGDFAQAYVIAHEVGHHVQNLLGTSRRVQSFQARTSEVEGNRASVHLELQADYFAGVWAHYVEHRMQGRVTLEAGDYEEAIRAANAIGDDVLQKKATGRVVPEKFTHGTAAQRAKWFKLGFESGNPKAHDPFTDEK